MLRLCFHWDNLDKAGKVRKYSENTSSLIVNAICFHRQKQGIFTPLNTSGNSC